MDMEAPISPKITLSKLAIASIVLALLFPVGIYLLVTGDWYYVPGYVYVLLLCSPIAAIILGHLSLRRARRAEKNIPNLILAFAGLSLGYLSPLSIPVANLFRCRGCEHQELSAVGSLRTLHAATDAYASAHPARGFPANLHDLSCSKEENGVWCVDPNLESGIKSGYRFTYIPRSTHDDGRLDAYEVFADPVKRTRYTRRHFFGNETGMIRVEKNEAPATANSDPL